MCSALPRTVRAEGVYGFVVVMSALGSVGRSRVIVFVFLIEVWKSVKEKVKGKEVSLRVCGCEFLNQGAGYVPRHVCPGGEAAESGVFSAGEKPAVDSCISDHGQACAWGWVEKGRGIETVRVHRWRGVQGRDEQGVYAGVYYVI